MDLRDYYEIILKRRWIILFVSICVILGYSIFFFTQSPSYSARGRLLLRLPPEWQDMPVISMPSWQTRVSLINSQPVLEGAAERLREKGYNATAEGIQAGLELSPQDNTDFVDIYYTSNDPERCIAIINSLMDSFLEYDRQSNSTNLANAEEALTAEVKEARRKLNRRENRTAKLRSLYQISIKVRNLQEEYEETSNQYGPQHPQHQKRLRRLRSQTQLLRSRYQQYFPKDYNQGMEINDLLVQKSDVSKADRNLEIATERLSNIRESLDQVNFNKSLIGQSATTISRPEHTSVSYPTNYKTYGFVTLAGIILGISTGAFLEYFDDKIVSKFDVHRYLGLKVLGEVPEVGEDINLLKSPQKTPMSERYHSISVLIEHSLLKGRTRNSLLVTGSDQGEGKTTTTVNLGVSLAREGERVLIMDFDLRAPQIHKTFGLMNSEGTSSILTGSLELEHAMYQGDTDYTDNAELSWDFIEPLVNETPEAGLEVLPSGPLPSNPIQAIKSDYTENLINLAKKHYSIVLLDSPPINAVVDPIILSTLVDGVLMVLESGKARTGSSQHAKHLLEDVDANVLGVILNRLKRQIPAYYSYYSDSA